MKILDPKFTYLFFLFVCVCPSVKAISEYNMGLMQSWWCDCSGKQHQKPLVPRPKHDQSEAEANDGQNTQE